MKINLRESLNKIDLATDNKYDLLNTFDSKKLSDENKKKLAEAIENNSMASVNKILHESEEQLFKVVIQSGATKRDFESALYEDEAEEIVDYYGGRWIDENGFEWNMYVEEDDDSTEHAMVDIAESLPSRYWEPEDDRSDEEEYQDWLDKGSVPNYDEEPPFESLKEAVYYPNGKIVPEDSVDMDKYLDYNFGKDRNKDNSTFTTEEKQRAVDYWFKKHEPSPYDESLTEASYGGAYDIEDDMFFTKEDIVEFADNICEYLGDIFGYQYDINNVYMDGPRKLYINIYDNNYIEVESTFDIDMRKIRKPSDLSKVYGLTIENWFQKAFAREYRDAGLDESLTEDMSKPDFVVGFYAGPVDDETLELVNPKKIAQVDVSADELRARYGKTVDKLLNDYTSQTVDKLKNGNSTLKAIILNFAEKKARETGELDNKFRNEERKFLETGIYMEKRLEEINYPFEDGIKKLSKDLGKKLLPKRENLDEQINLPGYAVKYVTGYAGNGVNSSETEWFRTEEERDKRVKELKDKNYTEIKTWKMDNFYHTLPKDESLKEAKIIEPKYRDGDVVFVGDASGYHGTFLIKGDFRNIPEELYHNIRQITKYGNLDKPYYKVEYKIDSNHLFEEDYRKFFEYITPILKDANISILRSEKDIDYNESTRNSLAKFNELESLQEKLNNIEKHDIIKAIINGEEDDLQTIVDEIYFYDRALYLKLRHFTKKNSLNDKKDYLIKVLQNSLEESLTEDARQPWVKVGDRVKIVKNKHWTKAGDEFIGLTGTVEDYNWVGMQKRLSITLDNPFTGKYGYREFLVTHATAAEDEVEIINDLTEDTIKQNCKWVNKGSEGTHGKFKTKKAADAQRKAMFANGYKAESLKEAIDDEIDLDYETDFDDDGVEEGNVFVEGGVEYAWIQREAGPLYLDFDKWAVWSAREYVDPSEFMTIHDNGKDYDFDGDAFKKKAMAAPIVYFVVEEDTGFIDWGPVESRIEAQDFLNGKQEDWDNNEYYGESLEKNLDEWYVHTLHYEDIGDGREYDYEVDHEEVLDYLSEIAIDEEDAPEDTEEYLKWVEDNFDELFNKYEYEIEEHFREDASQEEYDRRHSSYES